MDALIQYLKETRMQGLKGTNIEGEIPIDEVQLNELIRQFAQERLQGSGGGGSSTSTTGSGSNPLMELLPYLNFPRLEVKLKKGQLVVRFQVTI